MSGKEDGKKRGEKPGDKRGEVVPLRLPRPCPICSRPSNRETFPFCSKRCADIDLNRWLNESYAIPGEPVLGQDDEDH